MIHILTLHYATPAWLEIQKRHILKYTNSEHYKLWLGKYNTDIPENFEVPDNWEIIDLDEKYPEELGNEHYFQIEWMYENWVKERIEEDDIIVFMDNDAFPCCPQWSNLLRENLTPSAESPQGVCVIETNNRGVAQPDYYFPVPDLCFFATTKKARFTHDLKWGIFNNQHQNPAFGMLDKMMASQGQGAQFVSLERSNRFNAHNVMFGVYGNMIYHQACGTRSLIGRPLPTGGAMPEHMHGRVPAGLSPALCHVDANKRRQCYTGIDVLGRKDLGQFWPGSEMEFEDECADIIQTNLKIFDVIYDELVQDKKCEFVRRYFMGLP